MDDPYQDFDRMRRRYAARLVPLGVDELDELAIAIYRAYRDLVLAGVDEQEERLGELVEARLQRLGGPRLRGLDRHDVAEVARLLPAAGCGRLLAVAVELMARPGTAHLHDAPGSEVHLLGVRQEAWRGAWIRLLEGGSPAEVLREVADYLRRGARAWALDPIRAETYEHLGLQVAHDAVASFARCGPSERPPGEFLRPRARRLSELGWSS